MKEIEVAIPPGNHNPVSHFRFAGDYRSFCGKDCMKWIKTKQTAANALESKFTCKRCIGVYLK